MTDKPSMDALASKMKSDYPAISGLIAVHMSNLIPLGTEVNQAFFNPMGKKFPEYKTSYTSIYKNISDDIGALSKLYTKITSVESLKDLEIQAKFKDMQTKYVISMYEELQKASKPQPDGVFVGVESDKIEKYTKSIIGVMKAHEFIGLVPVIVLDQGLVKQALGSSEKTRLATPTDDEHKATNRILTQQIPLTSLDQATSLTAVAKRNAAELDRLAKAVAPYTATTPATSNLPRNTQRADMRTNTGFNPK